MLLEDFQTDGETCNLVAAAQQCALCCMVYEDDAAGVRAFVEPEGELLYFHESRATWNPAIAVVRSGANRYFVISEGTISFTQALAQGSPLNALQPIQLEQFTITSCYGMFYAQVYQQMRELIAPFVPYSDPNLRLFLSGHSMGGAVAQVAAFEFARLVDASRVQLLTIGAPKAGGGQWDYPQPSVHWRLESTEDVVTTYPISFVQWFFNFATFRAFRGLFPDGWQHYGRQLYLSSDGTDNRWNSPKRPFPRGFGAGPENEHYLGNYLARIQIRAEAQAGA